MGEQTEKKSSRKASKYNARLRDEIQLNEGKLNKKQSKHIMSSEESSSNLLKADLIPPEGEIEFQDYKDESQLTHVMKLVLQDLSEPYSSKLLFLGENKNCMHLDSPSHIPSI